MDNRPVVVNDLLCFIHNYRHQLTADQLRRLIRHYFPIASIASAHALLFNEFVDEESTSTTANSGDIVDQLFAVFDQCCDQSPPVFAASNLDALPLRLISDSGIDDVHYSNVLREIRQLKKQIADAGWQQSTSSAVDSLLNVDTLVAAIKSSPVTPTNSELTTGATVSVSASSPESPTTSCGGASAKRRKTDMNTIGGKLGDVVKRLASRQNHNTVSTSSHDRTMAVAEEDEPQQPSICWPPIGVDPSQLYMTMIRQLMHQQQQQLQQRSIFPSIQQPVTMVTKATDDVRLIKEEEEEDDEEEMNDDADEDDDDDGEFARSTIDDDQPEMVMHEEDDEDDDHKINICNGGGADSSAAAAIASKHHHHRNRRRTGAFALDSSVLNQDATEKPFECQHTNCHKRFANKFLLKKHEFIHTGERPHQCPYCGKRFNRKDNLLRHKKTHLANALQASASKRRHTMVFGVEAAMALAVSSKEEPSYNSNG